MGRIPLAVHLGYALGDRARAEVLQFDRDRASWAWDPEAKGVGEVSVRTSGGRRGEANLVVSLSARLDREDVPTREVEAEIQVPEPSVPFLRERRQLRELVCAYEIALTAIRSRRCGRFHIYHAGPAARALGGGREGVVW
jgi:hypothetical protein